MGEEGGEGSSQPTSWLLRFSGAEEYKKVMNVFTKCLWETLHQVSWGKIKVCRPFGDKCFKIDVDDSAVG